MTEYKLVPLEPLRRALVALERFAYDTVGGRNAARELRELLAAPPSPAQQPVDGAKETELWRCTICGRVGAVGRCCGEETREPFQPTADQFIATFRCENNGIVGTTNAKIHSVTRHDDGCIEVVIDHWPEQTVEQQPEVLAKGYFHPLPDENDYEFYDAEEDFPNDSDCPTCVPAVIVRNSAVANQPVPDVSALVEALEVMVEMVEMGGFGKAYAMDIARAALATCQKRG